MLIGHIYKKSVLLKYRTWADRRNKNDCFERQRR
jgi:hypothetical protein